MQTSPSSNEALPRIGLAILSAIESAGELGAPGGLLYAGLMAHGASLSQYQSLMAGLERKGKVRREGELYFLTIEGLSFKRLLEQRFG